MLGLFRSLLFVGRWNILMWNLALTEGGVLEFRVVPCCPEDELGCVTVSRGEAGALGISRGGADLCWKGKPWGDGPC